MVRLNTALIAQTRREKKITQAQLAEKIDTVHSAVSRIENGITKKIPFEVICRIAIILDLDLNNLYIVIDKRINPEWD